MKSFEEYLWMEEMRSRKIDHQRLIERHRRRTREERRMEKISGLICLALILMLAAWAAWGLSQMDVWVKETPAEQETPAPAATAVTEEVTEEAKEEGRLPYDTVEAAPASVSLYREDVPLDRGEQYDLYDACEEFGVEHALLLGLIDYETDFGNLVGDGGDSVGYCQIQEKWWRGLMDEIGAKDLSVPEDNFRTGCAILVYLQERYGTLEDALTAYNTGSPGKSQYASNVLELREKWRAGNE